MILVNKVLDNINHGHSGGGGCNFVQLCINIYYVKSFDFVFKVTGKEISHFEVNIKHQITV